MIKIYVKNISFGYRKSHRVINNLTLQFHKGETWGILGHNGAGKTTLFRLILGLLKPSKGEIEYDNMQGYISYLPETNGIYEKLTCIENLRFRGSIFGVESKEVEEKAYNILKRVGLQGKEKEKAAYLSGGMKKRLGFGCTIMNPSNLILLDEPTNGLDPESLELVLNLINELKNEERIILVNSHDLNSVKEVCSNVVIMQNGMSIYEGDANKPSIREFYLKTVRHWEGKVRDDK